MPRRSPKPQPKRLRRDSRASRERLILAAERLFAEHGINGVSLREINRSAGQKNVSSLQYHFGTKKDLLAAIFRHRVPEIEMRRRETLERLKATGGMSDLRQILNAMVEPFVEQLDSGKNKRFYVRFIAQLYSHPSIDGADFASAGYLETYGAAQDLLAAKFPASLAGRRLALQVGHMIHALADFESRVVKQGAPVTPERIQLFVSDLLDSVVGALTAPVSPATAALLRRRQ
jgi:AcrR family transcriptional regulator